MDHIYIYISKVHRHGNSKIRSPSTIPARSNVRVAAYMFLRIAHVFALFLGHIEGHPSLGFTHIIEPMTKLLKWNFSGVYWDLLY